jgi:K+-sensing histidine kinase KdpD
MDNLMDWTKVQMENIAISPKRFDLYDCTAETLELLKNNIESSHIDVRNNVPPDTLIYADHELVHAIVRNILLNALRFADQGSVLAVQAEHGSKEIAFTVQEQLKGPKDKRITVAYGENGEIKQIETVKEKETGMGLLLSRELAEKIGGSLSFNSSPKEGIRIIFHLPSGFPDPDVKNV